MSEVSPRGNVPALTGIRGIAALLVLLFHLPFHHLPVIRNGFYGVDLFFVLSGFILMHVHERDFRALTWQGTKTFFTLRFFRVYPPHFAVLMVIAALVIIFPAHVTWARSIPTLENAYSVPGFIQTLTLTNRVGLPDLGQWNGPSWSLSSEALGYLFFPVLAWAFSTVVVRNRCVLVAIILLCGHAAMMYTGHTGVARVAMSFPAGMALGRAFHIEPLGLRYANALALFSTAIALLALSIDVLSPLSVFGFAGLIYALGSDAGLMSKLLKSRPAMFLGRISFSLYLTHHALFMFVSWWRGEPGGLSLVVVVIAALGLATLTHWLVEVPSHQYARRLARSRRAYAEKVSAT